MSLLEVYIHHKKLKETFEKVADGRMELDEGIIAYALINRIDEKEDLSDYTGIDSERCSEIIEDFIKKGELKVIEGRYTFSKDIIEIFEKLKEFNI